MDKRIDLHQFKTHIDSNLALGNENFRVYRICHNDIECEISSPDNQFSYIPQNSKFLIKLGPPLKYGEYVLPLFMLNMSTVVCSFLT